MPRPEYRQICAAILSHNLFVVLVSCLTIYCLFGQDVKTIAFGIDETLIFDAITLAAFVLFSCEILLSCIVHKHYPFSFFFFLDIVSTSTLILDVSFIGSSLSGGALSQTARASRAGTRATRVIRIIRLIRLLRVFKLFKLLITRRDREDPSWDKGSEIGSSKSHNEDTHESESQMGNAISRVTSKRMVFAVLIVIFLVPQIDLEAVFVTKSDIHQVGLTAISDAFSRSIRACRSGNSTLAWKARINYEKTLLHYVEQACNSLSDCPSGDVPTRVG